jgi:Domain of unknown function (DUF1833)
MTDLTAAQKEAYARAHTSTVHLWALEFRHPTFSGPLRVVQYKDDITLTLEVNAPIDGGTSQLFTALAFQMKEPDVNTEPDSTLTVQVDGVSGAVQPLFATANQSYTPIEVTLRPFTYDVVGQVVGETLGVIHLQVRHIAVTKKSVSLQMGYTNSANRAFPAVNYTAQSNPGLL